MAEPAEPRHAAPAGPDDLEPFVARWFAAAGPGVYRQVAEADLRARALDALTVALAADEFLTAAARQRCADAVTAAVLRWVYGHANPALLPGDPADGAADEFIPCGPHRPDYQPACEDCLVVRFRVPAGLLKAVPDGWAFYRYDMPCTAHPGGARDSCRACRVVRFLRPAAPDPPEPEPEAVLECRAQGHDFPTSRRHADLRPGELETCGRCGAVRLADDQGTLGFRPAPGSRGY